MVDLSCNGVQGFDATLADGRTVSYRAVVDHAPLTAVGVQADAASLLVISDAAGRKAGVVLNARSFAGKPAEKSDFEFETVGAEPPKFTLIAVPTGFCWTGTGDRLAPAYTTGPSDVSPMTP